MLDPQIFRLAEIIHNERLAEAAQRRQYAVFAARSHWRDRMRLVLSDCLISWGQRIRPQTVPTGARS